MDFFYFLRLLGVGCWLFTVFNARIVIVEAEAAELIGAIMADTVAELAWVADTGAEAPD